MVAGNPLHGRPLALDAKNLGHPEESPGSIPAPPFSSVEDLGKPSGTGNPRLSEWREVRILTGDSRASFQGAGGGLGYALALVLLRVNIDREVRGLNWPACLLHKSG